MKNAALLLLLFAFSFQGKAGTVYNIDFNFDFGGSGIKPTSGTFTYDPLLGFSGFVVIWNGNTFDLTAAANTATSTGHPPFGGTTAPRAAFDLMIKYPDYG